MKTHLRRLILYLIVGYLGYYDSAAIAAFPLLPSNEIHLCGYSELQRSTQKPVRTFANRDIGAPRTVRLIYFLPADRQPREDIESKMDTLIKGVREFYADQMENHGLGRRTFNIETDYSGKAVVHRVYGQFFDSYYRDSPHSSWLETFYQVWNEVHKRFDTSQNIYLAAVDVSNEQIGNAAGVGSTYRDWGGFAAIPASGKFFSHPLAAHELGHTFGLKHDFRANEHVMSYGPWVWGQTTRLSRCAVKWLQIQRYFNPAISSGFRNPPAIDLVSPRRYAAGSESISIQLRVSDFEGLHQVLVFGVDRLRNNRLRNDRLRMCREFRGEKQGSVEFDYDGDFTVREFESLSDRAVHPIRAVVVDINGNKSETDFNLFPETLHALTKISGDNQPAGLPSTPLPLPFIVELRDVNTGLARPGVWVSFSVTAGGGNLSTTGVSTLDNGRAMSTLTLGPNLGPNTVNASALGFTVTFNASAGQPVEIPDPKLRIVVEKSLEKVAGEPISQAEMATLVSTKEGTWSVGISDLTGMEFAVNFTHLDLRHNAIEDIYPLAGLVNLIQLALSGNSISDLSPLSGLTKLTWLVVDDNSVSEISDVEELTGLTLLALRHNSIEDISPLAGLTNLESLLLDANKVSEISSLEGLTTLRKLQLSDNKISDLANLVSNMGLGNGDEIDLRENLLSYVSIKSHIPTLKARGVDIMFDDRNPTELSQVSGKNQSGAPGAALPNPFVVEVKDENGFTFEGVPVAFSVTEGGGSLNTPNATTDSNGRAECTLTLGQVSVRNTVRVKVEEILQPLTFTAKGIRVANEVSKISGDNQEGFPGEPLSNPLVIEVRDQSDKPLPGVEVTFEATAGGGTLSVTTAKTNSSGRAESRLTLGSSAGTNTVAVSASGIDSSIIFNAEGVRFPQKIVIISGDLQEGLPGAMLGDPFVVEVQDKQGAPLEGVVVTFTVTAGHGTLSITSTQTSANGRSESWFTLGTNPGIHTAEVSAAGVKAPVLFNAFAKIREFALSVPRGTSLVHVPLRVTSVGGETGTIESVSDLYEALGGAATVNLLTTRDRQRQQWRSYLGDSSRGKAEDPQLTDDEGIIASMRAPVELLLAGHPLGEVGSSKITLMQGKNLVAVPLRDSRIERPSDLLALEGVRGNVSSVTVSVDGIFKVVAHAGDDGDVPITGGQSFIMDAQSAVSIAISGDGWGGFTGTGAAAPLSLNGINFPKATPLLCIIGSIIYENGTLETDLSITPPVLRVTLTNLASGMKSTVLTTNGGSLQTDGIGYQLTLVETAASHAARVGDAIEISAEFSRPLIGVQPLHYTVTDSDVINNKIQLPEIFAYEIPIKTALLPNYPNPFNPETWMPYQLAHDANVTLTIFDIKGAAVRRLELGHRLAGYYTAQEKAAYWDGRNKLGELVASGVYFYQLRTPSFRQLRRMVILK